MKMLDSLKSFLHLAPRPQLNFPAFGEPAVADTLDFSFALDEPMKSPLADKRMCNPERVPGLVRVLEQSQASEIPRDISLNKALLNTGITIAGPALGLPGIASLHFTKSANGIEFSAVDANQSKVQVDGRVRESYDRIELKLQNGRKIEVDHQSLYPKVAPKDEFGLTKTEAFGLPIPSSTGIQVKSFIEDSQAKATDCLITNFNEQGDAVQAGYERRLPDYRSAELKFRPDEGVSIILRQGGTGDGSKAEQNVYITSSGIKNESFYHSIYDDNPF